MTQSSEGGVAQRSIAWGRFKGIRSTHSTVPLSFTCYILQGRWIMCVQLRIKFLDEQHKWGNQISLDTFSICETGFVWGDFYPHGRPRDTCRGLVFDNTLVKATVCVSPHNQLHCWTWVPLVISRYFGWETRQLSLKSTILQPNNQWQLEGMSLIYYKKTPWLKTLPTWLSSRRYQFELTIPLSVDETEKRKEEMN